MTRITWTPLHNTMLRRVSHKKPSYHTHSDSKLQFPHFKKLELSDRETIESFVSKYPPYSDFNFTSLWSYNVHDEAEFSFLNDNLVVKFHDYITGEPFYTFIGENKPVETVETLLKSAQENGLAHKLKLIPEVVAKALANNKHNFSIVEDHANHDYIYSVKEHAELKGSKYSDKRNLISRFKNRYSNFLFKQIYINQNEVQNDIVKLLYSWLETKGMDIFEIKNEFIAIKRLISSIQKIDVRAHGIYINDEMVGFSICEFIHHGYVITHFEKVDRSVMGLSSYLRKNIAEYLMVQGFEYINYEQDLGIIGLRKAKSLWQPVHYLKKYEISY